MIDWLHCNTCYHQPGDGRCYFLTSCGHIFCEGCQNIGWKDKCMKCGTPNPAALKLTAKLNPPVDAFFAEPIKMMKQIFSEMKQLIATSEFQHHQRKRFVSQLLKNISQQKTLVEQQEQELKAKFQSHFEEMQQEFVKLKEENSYLKRLFLSDKMQGHVIKSPSGDRLRTLPGPNKGFESPGVVQPMSCTSSVSSLGPPNRSISTGMTMITSGRISVRTPPSGGRIGVIPGRKSPSPMPNIPRTTPKSVPHHNGFDMNMNTTTPI